MHTLTNCLSGYEWFTSLPQSGFRMNHSTETLLVGFLSYLYGAMVCGQITLLSLFDVSSVFDSVDHAILFKRLSVSFLLVGKPLDLAIILSYWLHCCYCWFLL